MGRKTKHDLIREAIIHHEDRIKVLEKNLDTENEPATKECPQCKTMNLMYSTKSNSFTCAFC